MHVAVNVCANQSAVAGKDAPVKFRGRFIFDNVGPFQLNISKNAGNRERDIEDEKNRQKKTQDISRNSHDSFVFIF